ncbi:MAG: M16 family metallopeptidase [Sphingorhabdus sp.]
MGKSFIVLRTALLSGALLSSVGLFAAAPEAKRTAPWNSETTELEADSRIVYGVLPNGLRYAIRRNNRPENQVVVRMALDFGSAAEAEDEQGLAHFIEHMAFNGSTNVPEGEMVRMLERLGLSFGADTNASTGYTRTEYKLDLPKTDPALIRQALFLMRETASELTFNPKAVDRERGVVIAEMRDRENTGFRRNRAANDLLYPGSFYATRYPIGKLDVLQNASAEKMAALYRRWYVPDRTRLVIVGPIDPIAIEKEIVRQFSSWQGSGKALGEIDKCSFDTSRPAGADIFAHPETNEAINIEQIVMDRPRPDTFERALLDVRMVIAGSILSDRIERRRRKEDIPLLGTGLSFQTNFCDSYARIGMGISAKDGSWKTVLPIAEQMVRQAVEYGFTEQELAEQLRRFDASFANAVASEATTPSAAFANELSALEDDIVTAADYRLRLWKQLRPFMTTQSVSREFADWYGRVDRPQIFLSTRNAGDAKSTDLLEAFNQSRRIGVAAPAARNNLEWAYSDFGAPGVVSEDQRIADLDIRTIRFANGVLLNLKRTDFEKDQVRWSLRIDGGRLAMSSEQQPLAVLMNDAFAAGGTGKYDADDLRSLLSGTTASASLVANTDHFGSQGSVVSKDLERQFELLAALVSDPGYRDEAVRLFKRPLPEFYQRMDATPGSALTFGQARIMTANDPRFVLPPREVLEATDFAQLKTALGDRLLTGRLEIGLVGDFEEAQAIAIVAKTFGALPTRRNKSTINAASNVAPYAPTYGTHILYHRGESNQLTWRRVWPTTDDCDFKLQQTMGLLADVVQIRLLDELRENLGVSYSSGANSDMSNIFHKRGSFSITTSGDPKDLEKIETTVDAVIAEILEKPVAADLFERARKPVLERFADWRRRNSTWIAMVDEAQTRPDRLQRFRDNEAQFRTITANDMWREAQRFLLKDKSYIFRVLPKPTTIE